MNNVNIPKDNELPSSKQLIQATVVALVVALILLVSVILPAEYGIDPTGAGETLGLTKMGEIKKQLAGEAKQEEQQPATEKSKLVNEPVATDIEEELVVKTNSVAVVETETRSIQLKPGEAAEIKLSMKKDAVVTYEWTVNTGHVNYYIHGDGFGIKYFGYDKGIAKKEDKGELKAAFDGKHGWFWRNRSNQVVTVTLSVFGDYNEIHRVL
jgi:hypothetical protein